MEFPFLAVKPDAMPELAILIAFAPTYAAIHFYNRWKKVRQTYQLMLNTKPCPDAAISEGPCEFQGKIGNVEPPLVSPWSQQKCVYYDFDVEEWRNSSQGSSYWSNIFEDGQTQSFTVTDTSGSVGINPYEGRFHVKIDRRTHSGSLNNTSPELQTLLKNRYGNPISLKVGLEQRGNFVLLRKCWLLVIQFIFLEKQNVKVMKV